MLLSLNGGNPRNPLVGLGDYYQLSRASDDESRPQVILPIKHYTFFSSSSSRGPNTRIATQNAYNILSRDGREITTIYIRICVR